MLVRQLSRAAPSVTAQQFDWSGRHTGYGLRPAAAAPCAPVSSAAGARKDAAAAAWSAHSCAASAALLARHGWTAPATLLESVLQLLAALCLQRSRPAAAVLYMDDISTTLQQLLAFSTPAVVALAEQLCGWLCLASRQLRDEVLADGDLAALSGILQLSAAVAVAPAEQQEQVQAVQQQAAVHAGLAAGPLRTTALQALLAACLDKLLLVLDGASGGAFQHFVGAADSGSGSRAGAVPGERLEAAVARAVSGRSTGLAGVVRLVVVQRPMQHQQLQVAACKVGVQLVWRCSVLHMC